MSIASVRNFIEMYELMLLEGKIKVGGSNYNRLQTLKTRLKNFENNYKKKGYKSLSSWIDNTK